MNIELLQAHNKNALHSINDNVKELLKNFSGGFEDYLSSPMLSFHKDNATTFPFHDISKDGDDGYILEIALAGYSKEDITVEERDGFLTVASSDFYNKKELADEVADAIVVKNISKRKFKRTFSLNPNYVVAAAEMIDGLLKVRLKMKADDQHKKVIPIE